MKHTVLVVEDEKSLRELMCMALEMKGYDVVCVENGQQALEAIDRIEHVCVVLLDLLMPVMNGWDFWAAIQQRPAHAGIPVVVHTSEANQAPVGVTRVLQKPIRLDRLVSVVQEYCAA